MSSTIDMTNQRFGRLVVLERDFSRKTKNTSAYWFCQCDCGNIKSINGASLRNGQTKSCGCLREELRSENGKKFFIDLTGKRFGHLLVIERDYENSPPKKPYWICQCDCGNKTSVFGSYLRTGDTTSCGCNNSSKGEFKIKEILTENNIPFVTQKTFKDCILESGMHARFDFWVNDSYAIEYDGEQHFMDKSDFFSDSLKDIQNRDKIKTDYCLSHGITLIRIPYFHYSKISLSDLQLESDFKVSKVGEDK